MQPDAVCTALTLCCTPYARAGVPKGKQPLAKQQQSILASGLTLALLAWGVVQQQRPDSVVITAKTVGYILTASYLYTDFWLWMLHCFLDRKENLKSVIPFIKSTAEQFQGHHDKPHCVLSANHFGEIDDLVVITAGTGLLLGLWTSPATKLIVVLVTLWGGLGGLNHFYGHAITHGYRVPKLYELGQRFGLLPTAKHHKRHHTAPFEENWNFLNGLHKVYEPIYFATGSSYTALFGMFYSLNPGSAQLLFFAGGLLV